jgi:hypothetical protein
MVNDLNEGNILSYTISSYNNSQCVDVEEFEDDIKIPKYIKRLINRYVSFGELKERLILNHIILFYNVFGNTPSTRILFFKLEEIDYSILKTFLTYLNVMPDVVEMISGKTIVNSDIPICQEVADRLRNL